MTLTWQAVADWFVHPTVFSVGISLIVFGFTLGTLERLFHTGGRERNGSRSRLLDLIFWFFTPLVTNFVTTSLLLYILGRLVNVDDGHFGISPDELRHGTFGRFRLIVNIDSLDKELRSNRVMIARRWCLEH